MDLTTMLLKNLKKKKKIPRRNTHILNFSSDEVCGYTEEKKE